MNLSPLHLLVVGIVVLVLFLSGIRNATDTNGDGNLNENIRVLIGGVDAPVLYASRQPDFVGLDQVNVVVPSSLVGRGKSMSLSAEPVSRHRMWLILKLPETAALSLRSSAALVRLRWRVRN